MATTYAETRYGRATSRKCGTLGCKHRLSVKRFELGFCSYCVPAARAKAPQCLLCAEVLRRQRRKFGVCTKCIPSRTKAHNFAATMFETMPDLTERGMEQEEFIPDPRGQALHLALLTGATYSQIGRFVGLSGERIRQLHRELCLCAGLDVRKIRAIKHRCRVCGSQVPYGRRRCDACIKADRDAALETATCATCGKKITRRKSLRTSPSRARKSKDHKYYCDNPCFYARVQKLGEFDTMPCGLCGVTVKTNPGQRYRLRHRGQVDILCHEHSDAVGRRQFQLKKEAA